METGAVDTQGKQDPKSDQPRVTQRLFGYQGHGLSETLILGPFSAHGKQFRPERLRGEPPLSSG